MIAHLSEKLDAFPGEPNRTRCFAHILNLVAKCVMKQFDAPKKKKTTRNGGEGEGPDEEDVEIGLLSEVESEIDGDNGEEGLDGGDDDSEEVPDGREGMNAAEVRVLEESVKPVRHVLTKVSHHLIIDDNLVTLLKLRKAAYAIKNSSTLILPEWFAVLEHMEQEAVEQGNKPLSRWMMPRDVAIHWNSTYEMLSFAYTYRQAYNELTDNRGMKLRKYEVLDPEWEIVNQLAKVLKVSSPSVTIFFLFFSLLTSLDL